MRRGGILLCAIASCGDDGAARVDGDTSAATVADVTTSDDVATGSTSSGATTQAQDDSSVSGDDPDPTTDDGGSTGDTGGVPGAWCDAIPTCDAVLPPAGPLLEWAHSESSIVTASGGPNHRGRDMLYGLDDPQWVLAKFAYGPTDYDLEDEQVDAYLLRDCTGDWEPLGSLRTTNEGDHGAVEGVTDTGGRIYFEIPADAQLGPGRHRVHFVVRGDGSRADQYVEVVPEGTPLFVADVDGTLTTSETEEFFDLLSGTLPAVQPGAPAALQALAAKGYHPVYITARPEFLGTRTQQFVHDRGLPPGIVHTTLNYDGALGDAAIAYKLGELQALAVRGLVPSWAFGNTSSDADAYDMAGIEPVAQRVFLQYDDAHGGRRIESWDELVAELEALPDLCE